jgi:hypothetical protein
MIDPDRELFSGNGSIASQRAIPAEPVLSSKKRRERT